MTEQEAIEIMERNFPKKCRMVNGRYQGGFDDTESDFGQALTAAITALKEIRLYRDNRLCLIPEDVYSRQCSELDAYKEIGTVEECREAREKQTPKAPKDSLKIEPVIDENGAYVDADTTVYLLCPNCEELVGIEENCDNYCRECGQKIDKESEEE